MRRIPQYLFPADYVVPEAKDWPKLPDDWDAADHDSVQGDDVDLDTWVVSENDNVLWVCDLLDTEDSYGANVLTCNEEGDMQLWSFYAYFTPLEV